MKVIDMKKIQRRSFKLNPVAAAIMLAMAAQISADVAQANAGFGPNTNIAGQQIAVPTYYANSPQGWQPALDANNLPVINPATGNAYTAAEAYAANGNSTSGVVPMVNSGTAMRKFVEKLPGVYNGLEGAGIPVGIAEKWVDGNGNQTNDDYYEFAIVEYDLQMHPDLPKATRLRGYVQIETDNIKNKLHCASLTGGIANPNCADVTGIVVSESIPATYPDGTPIYKWKKDPVTGVWAKSTEQVRFVHKPNYLGPAIVAATGTPVRFSYYNYLPYTAPDGTKVGDPHGGEMPVPVDELIAGGGPVFEADGVTQKIDPVTHKPMTFTQNRVAIHWHGGDAPWISDGTPHQWVAPAGEENAYAAGIGKGVSFQNVPDMADPGPGAGTLYFPNNLSGRLMMYHDHVSGLTKVNAYMGEAAGYIVWDLNELGLVATTANTGLVTPAGGLALPDGQTLGSAVPLLDTVGIPLVIQDKGFVPLNMAQQDAKWDLNHWGQPGDLFFPHVYETNQDPNSADGTNPVGRWDWGPWFWPVFPSQNSLPSGDYGHATATPEAFMDTPTVNGHAYPYIEVAPKTYRFRILSIGNDRTQNLGLYQAVDAAGNICNTATPPVPNVLAPGETGVLANCTEVRMVPAVQTAGFPANWPTDGRAGGVPDPATAGPDIVQIGNEAGLLPAPAVWKSQPVTFDQNVRSITILNVLNHDLLLGGGERADVLIDFSKYAGKTLILYNDAPAPMPGFDPRVDYYTGKGDQSQAGGAFDTLPGYGPNTRTVMQIRVSAATPATSLSVAALSAAMPAAYAKSQPAPIIPEVAYNAPFGTSDSNNYAQIYTGSKTAPVFTIPIPGFVEIGTVDATTGLLTLVNAATVTNTGSGYKSTPIVTVTGGGGTGAIAVANMNTNVGSNRRVVSVTITNGGTGYTSTPTLVFSGGNPTRVAAASVATVPAAKRMPVINKAIQELFEPVYGRMNATLAVELPYSSATVATTIPLAYIDGPVDSLDVIRDGETQIWKITHNGVDTHPVHFHMVNVQVINRVDWAGTVKPPEPNEVGWKETLRMNPLEDVYVAVRGKRPVTPFGLPKSSRVLDPSQGIGSTVGFTQIDQTTGQAPTFQAQLVNGATQNVATTQYHNVVADFDNEYVWHCHILGHEENDFMRPFIFRPIVTVPDAPAAVTVNGTTVSWTDTTPFGGQDAQGVPTAGTNAAYPSPTNSTKNEIGFKVFNGATLVATLPANTTSWTDASVGAANSYSVVAYNAAGDSVAGTSSTTTIAGTLVGTGSVTAPASTVPVPTAPSGLTQTLNADGTVTLNWAAVTGATGYIVTINGVAGLPQVDTFLTIAGATGSTISVAAVSAGGTSAPSAAASVYNGTAYAPAGFAQNLVVPAVTGSVVLDWANNPMNANSVSGLTLSWMQSGVAVSKTFAPTTTGATIVDLTTGTPYDFTLNAVSNMGNSTLVTITVTAP